MNRARSFFYICAGLLLLSVVYHLGANSAAAQSPPTAYGIDMGGSVSMAAVGRTIYWMDDSGHISTLPSVPGSSPIAAMGAQGLGGAGVAMAILQDGDVYRKDYLSNQWLRVGNILNVGPVPGVKASWTEVKARFR
jgi:hypothetical protein